MQSHSIEQGNGSTSVVVVPGGMPSRSIAGTDASDFLAAGNTNDRVVGNGGNDTIFGFAGSDLLFGNQGSDIVFGNSAQDTLYGGRDGDTLYGGRDRDFLSGDLGSDFVSGDLGDDTLVGAVETRGDPDLQTAIEIDTLVGGAGSDVFVLGSDRQTFYNDADVINPGFNSYALIADFNSGEDLVQLRSHLSYVFGSDPTGNSSDLALFIDDDGISGISDRDELIAIFTGINSSDSITSNLVLI
jgi:Ca2+-binding RTX toxin-like protein